MKYKNNIFLILTITIISLFIGCNSAYADTYCYYINETDGTRLYVSMGAITYNIHTDFLGNKLVGDLHEELANNRFPVWVEGVYVPVNLTFNSGGCPPYLVVEENTTFGSTGIVIYDAGKESKAKEIVNALNKAGRNGYYASNTDKNGKQYTSTEYNNFTFEFDIGNDGTNIEIKGNCDLLFGDKNEEGSLANLIDTALQYVRIIVPILIIIFGILDFSKAVIAAKEDEMRKAQSTFIKRLLIGVAIFFIPLLVELIMKLADIIWEYNTCTKNI